MKTSKLLGLQWYREMVKLRREQLLLFVSLSIYIYIRTRMDMTCKRVIGKKDYAEEEIREEEFDH